MRIFRERQERRKVRENIVIATIKSWNVENTRKLEKILKNKYKVFLITKREDLILEKMKILQPQYIFFPHWSWIIPKEIYENFECVVFHMTDLPFGRGGSPLQNLIQRKIYYTKISAIQVDEGIDAGKVYLKKDLYIGMGSAEEIFIKVSEIIFFEMIPWILENRPTPCEQRGEVVIFKRRKAEDSDIMKFDLQTLDDFYDFTRMLDAEGYPKAFIKLNGLKILFSEIHRKTNKLVGRFEVIVENE